ncbi:3-hydroxyacyl-CoA dehydrogenase NAD-binding domain-containing protein [Marinobacter sp.]|uniref:3-hydroxyacyl-CoA dehydrogenase NAD-binding domain-containing protein n=1 Tax=Marinobacter sp. TaxID=50741 RepID=UPI0034A0DAE1
MDSEVFYERKGSLGIIRINNPPVNALSQSVRRGILKGLDQALADVEVSSIGICCEGKTFIAGADIKEFGKPPEAPFLPEVTDAIEASRKPVVAMIHGTALGGGLEIALASHYRIASRDSKFGMPEVNLGLIPGAGGTQRLPRLIGVPLATNMIARSEKIDAVKALEVGLVDEVVDNDSLFAKGYDFAREVATKEHAHPLVSNRPIPDRESAHRWLANEEGDLERRSKGRKSPLRSLQAIRSSLDLPFDEGCAEERKIFLEMKDSKEHQGLTHAFLAEREAFRVSGLDYGKAKTIRSVAVIGAGTMGRGIAISFLDAGIPVRLFEIKSSALENGVEVICSHYDRMVSKGRLDVTEASKRKQQLSSTLEYTDLSDVDLVIEAAIENMEIKCSIFKELDRVCRLGTMLATNTSTLDLDQIAGATSRPEDVVGLHFFSPANIMRLLEVVSGKETSDVTKATAMTLAKRLRKVGVLVGNCYGFVGNRILYSRLPEALCLVAQGATPAQVDRVLTDFGFPMGQFAMSDLAGLDIGYNAREGRRKTGEHVPRTWLDELVEKGRLGQKSGEGVYRYEEGSRTPIEDNQVDQIIDDYRSAQGITPRVVTDSEILERCLYVMVNEAFKILDEGIAGREIDIDVVWNSGYGFPSYRGGLMFWAREMGLDRIFERVQAYCELDGGEQWKPAQGLEREVFGS